MPAGLVVREIARGDDASTALVPYRSAPLTAPHPALEIEMGAARSPLRWLFILIFSMFCTPILVGLREGAPAWLFLLMAPPLILLTLVWLFINNRTLLVRADADGIAWTWRSLGVTRRRVLSINRVRQLYVLERGTSTTHRSARTYSLWVRDDRGRHREIGLLDSREQADWIEKRVEAHLGIPDELNPRRR